MSKLEKQPRSMKTIIFYHSIRSWTLTHWNSDGILEYPTALTSMMANYHLVANLFKIRKKIPADKELSDEETTPLVFFYIFQHTFPRVNKKNSRTQFWNIISNNKFPLRNLVLYK